MSFDLGAAFESAPGDGQVGANSEWIAPDEYYACTWEGCRQTARAFGCTGYDDEQLRRIANQILGRGDWHYGERWETNLAVMRQVWPQLAAGCEIVYPANADAALAAVRAYGAAGRRVHCGFWCDTNAWVPPQGPITYSHCLMSLAGGATSTTWTNPEPHPDVTLSDDEFRRLYDGGGLLVFPVHPSTDTGGLFMALTDDDQQALIWRVAALVKGSPTVEGGPTKGEPNALAISADFSALIWRVAALIDGLAAVADGPTKGEVNQLQARLDELKGQAASPEAIKALGDSLASIQAGLDALLQRQGHGPIA